MKYFNYIALCVLMSGLFAVAEDLKVELTTFKDTFGRSAGRNKNSGANPFIFLAPQPGVIGLIAFDLSSVTNEISSAEISIRIHESSRAPFSLNISPMVHNENNPEWIEGNGNLGIRGRNAEVGEVTFQWRAFRDRPWEDEKGKSVVNLMSSGLWKPSVEARSSIKWDAGNWLTFLIDDPAFLEEVRNSEHPAITFGIWGTAGNGVYKVSAKESGHPATLKLTLTADEKDKKQTP